MLSRIASRAAVVSRRAPSAFSAAGPGRSFPSAVSSAFMSSQSAPKAGEANKAPPSSSSDGVPSAAKLAETIKPPSTRRASDVAAEGLSDKSTKVSYLLPHPLYSAEFIDGVEVKVAEVSSVRDNLARQTIRLIRFNFDWMSGFSWRPLDEKRWLTRFIFLESIAAIPGAVAGLVRHLESLRLMRRDNGWIHTLQEEAENERMHLLTFIQLAKPSPIVRGAAWLSQGVFFNFFFIAYLVWPKFCHNLVSRLEEEAVITYTHCLSEIDKGNLEKWQTQPAPKIAVDYWKMPKDSTMRDVISVVRADEAHHRDVNHVFATIPSDAPNPFEAGH